MKVLIKLLISSLLLIAVIQFTDRAAFLRAVASVEMVAFSLAIGLYFPCQLLGIYRWYYLLGQMDRAVPLVIVARHYMLGQTTAVFLPSRLSGDVARIIAISYGQKCKLIFILTTVIDKVSLLIAILSFVLFGYLGSNTLEPLTVIYPVVLVLLLVTFVALIGLCRYRSDALGGLLARLDVRWIPKNGHTSDIFRLAALPRLPPSTILIVILLAFTLQFLNTMGSYFMARSMHIMVNPVDWASINGMVALGQVLPISIGGLGVREGLFATILSLYKIPVTQSVAFSLVAFVVLSLLINVTWLALEAFFGFCIGRGSLESPQEKG